MSSPAENADSSRLGSGGGQGSTRSGGAAPAALAAERGQPDAHGAADLEAGHGGVLGGGALVQQAGWDTCVGGGKSCAGSRPRPRLRLMGMPIPLHQHWHFSTLTQAFDD